MDETLRGSLEILAAGLRNVHEAMGIPVRQREPGALDLHHHSMAAPKDVRRIGQLERTRGVSLEARGRYPSQ
jgi:hypothetical protein